MEKDPERGGTDMAYKIACWIPVEEEEPEIYKTKKEAEQDLESLRLMQPENIYKIVPVRMDKKPPQR